MRICDFIRVSLISLLLVNPIMVQWKVPLFKMYCDDDDIQSVVSILKRGMFWGLSNETLQFEKMLTEITGTKHCVVFNSGTSALHAIMIAYGIKNPEEVIVPSFTFIATANAPLFVGAIPRFSDIEESTYGLDPKDVNTKITEKTKAIIPVHYAGNVCKIEELRELAHDSKVLLIEDAAAALGSSKGKKMAGSFGDSSIISFAWNKITTSGEGGAVLTDSKEIYEKLILIRSHGRIDKENYFMSANSPDYVTLGYNWRISAMTAALGLSQLKKLDNLINMRIKNSEYLSSQLSKFSFIETPKNSDSGICNYMMYTIRIKSGKKVRDQLHSFMTKKGIQTKVIFEPIHLTEFYRKKYGYKEGLLPITELVSHEVLTLPMFPHLQKHEMDYIIESVHEFQETLS